jgi:hypothetical protein
MEQLMSEGQVTTDHKVIRKWVEERGGVPTSVEGTGKGDKPGVLRIDFKPKDGELEAISWDEFFEKFERERLAFLYQDKTKDGAVSRFHKFVQR